jgi:hypothetical protein
MLPTMTSLKRVAGVKARLAKSVWSVVFLVAVMVRPR